MKKQVERVSVVSKYRDASGYEYSFSDNDVVDIGEWYPRGDYNPYNRRPFLLHDHGFTVCVVFADNLQDALDAAVDADKMDRYLINLDDPYQREDYLVQDKVTPGYDPNCPEYIDGQGRKFWWKEGMEPAFLGNAGEPFDIENLGVVELPNPPMSFCAVFNSQYCPVTE